MVCLSVPSCTFAKNRLAKTNKLAWDDLALVLAIARTGSLSGAGRALGTTHSTVYRKLLAMEARLQTRLVERLPDGYVLTAAGEVVRQAAERMEQEVHGLERRILGEDVRLDGALRITTTDTLACGVLSPVLARFRARHPGITLDLIVDNRALNLTRRDADVAVRPTRHPPETLVGRRIAAIATAVYGAPDYLRRLAAPPLENAMWVLPDDSLWDLPATRWGKRVIAADRVAVQASSVATMRELVRAGLGVAPLPCFLGDGDPGLARVTAPVAELSSELWLLTHPDLRRNARVRAFLGEVGDALIERKTEIEGSTPGVDAAAR